MLCCILFCCFIPLMHLYNILQDCFTDTSVLLKWPWGMWVNMMTSSNGNIFHVTGPLWGESTSHRGIPLTKASDVKLWFHVLNKWISSSRDAGDLRLLHAHYEVTKMIDKSQIITELEHMHDYYELLYVVETNVNSFLWKTHSFFLKIVLLLCSEFHPLRLWCCELIISVMHNIWIVLRKTNSELNGKMERPLWWFLTSISTMKNQCFSDFELIKYTL